MGKITVNPRLVDVKIVGHPLARLFYKVAVRVMKLFKWDFLLTENEGSEGGVCLSVSGVAGLSCEG